MPACLLLTERTECVWKQKFSNLLGLTLLLNEATGTEPPPLASLLFWGYAPLTMWRPASERPNVLGFVYSVQWRLEEADVSLILRGAWQCTHADSHTVFHKRKDCMLIVNHLHDRIGSKQASVFRCAGHYNVTKRGHLSALLSASTQ